MFAVILKTVNFPLPSYLATGESFVAVASFLAANWLDKQQVLFHMSSVTLLVTVSN